MTMFIGIFDTDTLLMVDIIENFDKIKKKRNQYINTITAASTYLIIHSTRQWDGPSSAGWLAGWLAG